MRLFKKNYSKKPMNKSLAFVMVISIIACSLFILYELSDLPSFKVSQTKSCLQSLDCDTDLDCFEKAVEKCGFSGEMP